MKKKAQSLVIAALVLLGVGFLLYSPISQWLAGQNASQFISSYEDEVESLEEQVRESELKKAEAFNRQLLTGEITDPFKADNRPDMSEAYLSTLNVTESGIMGYLEIPKVNIQLPIYHGVMEDTLKKGIGHLDNTALPVGGQGNHTVLTGHSGLASARLFTDLDRLQLQDVFHINVLGRKITYEVNQITVIEPHDTNALLPVPGKDYVTLITCTPYGINSHRLLVRGHQIPAIGEVVAPSPLLFLEMILPVLLLAFLVILLVLALHYRHRKRQSAQLRKALYSLLLIGLMPLCLFLSSALPITTLANEETGASHATTFTSEETGASHATTFTSEETGASHATIFTSEETGVLYTTALTNEETDALYTTNLSMEETGAILIHTNSLTKVDFTVTKMDVVSTPTDYQDMLGNYYERSSITFTQFADATKPATFMGLPLGIYYVEETSHNSAGHYASPFFVQLPSPHPKHPGEWQNTVSIYPKETNLSIDKYARNESSMGGRLAKWQISTGISPGLESSGTDLFSISDQLDNRLKYIDDSVHIMAGNEAGNLVDITHWFDVNLTGQTLTFTLKQEYYEDFKGYTQVDIDFTTALNIQNVNELTDIFNVATVHYQGVSQGVPDHPEDTIPFITPYGIQVLMQNSSARAGALAGAVFELLDYNGNPMKSPGGNEKWLVESDENGILWFLGLTEGTYYLRMVTPPKGFQPLTDLIPVVPGDNNTTENNVVTALLEMTEQKGILPRPRTGDFENLLFLFIGIAIGCGALLTLILNKKKKRKNEV